jgi:hypothetical protein
VNKKLLGAILTSLTFGTMSVAAAAHAAPNARLAGDEKPGDKKPGDKACGGPNGCGGAKKKDDKKKDGKACGGPNGCGGEKK